MRAVKLAVCTHFQRIHWLGIFKSHSPRITYQTTSIAGRVHHKRPANIKISPRCARIRRGVVKPGVGTCVSRVAPRVDVFNRFVRCHQLRVKTQRQIASRPSFNITVPFGWARGSESPTISRYRWSLRRVICFHQRMRGSHQWVEFIHK